jgi:hypothetical protein
MLLAPHRLRFLQDMLEVQGEIEENDVAIAQVQRRRRRPRRRRRCWVRDWIARRPDLGQYHQLMVELQAEDVAGFCNFLRIDPAMFQELLLRVGPRIERLHTWYRQPLEPGLKLAITLRHLATGDSYKSLMYSFTVAHNTISLFVPEVCRAIMAEYGADKFAIPTTPEEWQPIADQFRDRWNFPHTVGALNAWEAHSHQVSQELRLLVLQLQEILLHHLDGPRRCRLQIHLGGSRGPRFFIRCTTLPGFRVERRH